jgi:hypothetical protein
MCHNNTSGTHGDNGCSYLKIINLIPETMQCAEYKVNKKITNGSSFCSDSSTASCEINSRLEDDTQ